MVVDFGLAAMTSPAATTPLSKVSPSRMAAALFSASSSPLASCSSSSASPGAFQAVFSRADSGFSSAASSFCSPAFPALRSSFLGNSDSSLLQQERRSGELLPRARAPSISPLFSCALSTTTTTNVFGGLRFRSNFNSVGGPSADRRSNMSTTANASSASAPAAANTIHDFTVKDINGDEVNLSKFKGKVLLVVNVASACGLTSGNYSELAEVYSQLKDSGFEILAFPCNQFGGQEPGTNAQIKEFACTRYKAEYPLFDKVDVNGANTAPVYQFLKAKKGGGILGDSIKWNFGKFLINKDGIVVERYAPTTTPKKIVGDIEKLLNQ